MFLSSSALRSWVLTGFTALLVAHVPLAEAQVHHHLHHHRHGAPVDPDPRHMALLSVTALVVDEQTQKVYAVSPSVPFL